MGGSVYTSDAGGRTVYHLRDDETGASASILPSYGFNLFDLRMPVAGSVRPILGCEGGWPANPGPPARSGFPILFPFAGRIRHALYEFGGVTYHLAANKPPHAIHGFAYNVPWDVVEHAVGPEGATILGRFQISRHSPDALPRWPADAVLEVRYTLDGTSLAMEASVSNPSPAPLPWAFGVHSYFRLPTDGRDDFSGTRVEIPASRYWVLSDSLPTGETRDVDGTEQDYRRGRSMQGLSADIALTGLARDAQGWGAATLADDRLSSQIRLRFDRAFGQMIVFTPPAMPGVVAVEPYTAMADPFFLEARGAEPGLCVLEPGGSARFALRFEVGESPACPPSSDR